MARRGQGVLPFFCQNVLVVAYWKEVKSPKIPAYCSNTEITLTASFRFGKKTKTEGAPRNLLHVETICDLENGNSEENKLRET
jgi:hypothetical protein